MLAITLSCLFCFRRDLNDVVPISPHARIQAPANPLSFLATGKTRRPLWWIGANCDIPAVHFTNGGPVKSALEIEARLHAHRLNC